MSAITYLFKCANCGAEFMAPEVPGDSYGLFVMRAESTDDAAYLDAHNDDAFLESFELVKHNTLVVGLTVEKRGALQQAVFSTTCDPASDGKPFRIGLLPRCASCGSRRMESWEPVRPIQSWSLLPVKHTIWNAKTPTEKAAAIDQAVRLYLD
jgi:hypothetical protein